MKDKADAAHANFRPHFKTHQSAQIAAWCRAIGIHSCTVSSVSMAEYFVENGWDDVTIAFPYNPRESREITKLAAKACLTILLESEESLRLANEHIKHPIQYRIKLDVGTYRTGVDLTNKALLKKLIEGSTEKVNFKGFLAHAGHSYHCRNHEEIQTLFKQVEEKLKALRNEFNHPISFGDTPICSVVENLSLFDELRPGNLAFYDMMQVQTNACTIDDVAACLACPVVAKHPERNEVVVYGGGVHLSKDQLDIEGKANFGIGVKLSEKGWDTRQVVGPVKKLSQEHGIIEMAKEKQSELKVGDLIGILPVHSCLAADLQGYYLTTSGERLEKLNK